MKTKRSKPEKWITRDLTWYSRSFGPTEYGARGIEWPTERTKADGTDLTPWVSWNAVQMEELAPAAQAELAAIISISQIVQAQIERILVQHLARKKSGRAGRQS